MSDPEKKRQQTAKRQQSLRDRREAQGLKQCVVYAKPEHHKAIKAYAESLLKAQQDPQ